MREESVCHSGYFRAKCAWDELTVIAHARYGRMRINKCVSENFGYVGCSIDVIDVLDRYCSGRRSCYVRVLDETFTESTPCHEDLNLYLQVEYQCVRGILKLSYLLLIYLLANYSFPQTTSPAVARERAYRIAYMQRCKRLQMCT